MQRGMAPKATSEPLLCRPCCCPPGTDLAAATAAGARPWTPRCPWCVGELGAAAAALLGWAARCPLASVQRPTWGRPTENPGHVPALQLQGRLGEPLPSSQTCRVGNPPNSAGVQGCRGPRREQTRSRHPPVGIPRLGYGVSCLYPGL